MSNEFFLPSETEEKAPAKKEYSGPAFVLPSEEGKQEQYGLAGDTAMGAASGLARGVAGLPGAVGSMRELVDLGVRKGGSYVGSFLTGRSQEDIEKNMLAAAQEAEKRKIIPSATSFFPTSQETIGFAEKVAPSIKPVTSYEPTTVLGRMAQGTTEAIAGSVLGPGTAAQKAIVGGAAGLTGSAGKELFRGTDYELPAQVAGSFLGGIPASVVVARHQATRPAAMQEKGQQVAGQILRESLTDPDAVRKSLEAETRAMAQDAGRYAPGVKPTAAQATQNAQIANLENQLLALDPQSTQAIALRQQIEASRAALEGASAQAQVMAGRGVPQPNMTQAVGLQGVNPQAEASRNVRAAIDALEQAKSATSKTAWEDPLIKSANVYRGKALSQIDDYLSSLAPTDRSRLSPDVIQRIDALRTMKGTTTVPLMEIQAIRSMVLDEARNAFNQDKGSLGMIHQKLGSKLADVINNDQNIRFGDKTGQARKAWSEAVKATKDYHDTFRPDIMAKLVAEGGGGLPKIGGDAVIGTLYAGKNAVDDLRQVRAAVGPSIDNDISNWMIGRLTKNGTNVNVTQADVTKFLADPKNAAFAQEVPGLNARLMSVARQAGESEKAAFVRQLNEGLDRAYGSPDKLSEFLKKNGANLKAAIQNPQERKFVEALQRSADAMRRLPAATTNPSETLQKLQNGRIVDIIYGRNIGAISDALGGELVNQLGAFALGAPGSTTAAGAIIGGLSSKLGVPSFSRFTQPVTEVVGQFVLGDTKNIAISELQKAARDPEVFKLLMSKPTPENIIRLQDHLARIGYPIGYERMLDTKDEGGEYPKPVTIRPGRASGGKVGGSIGDKLVMAAERAKKSNNKITEPLLQAPDEHVAKALEIANRHI